MCQWMGKHVNIPWQYPLISACNVLSLEKISESKSPWQFSTVVWIYVSRNWLRKFYWRKMNAKINGSKYKQIDRYLHKRTLHNPYPTFPTLPYPTPVYASQQYTLCIKQSWSNSVIFGACFSIFAGPFQLVLVRFDPNWAVLIRSSKL